MASSPPSPPSPPLPPLPPLPPSTSQNQAIMPWTPAAPRKGENSGSANAFSDRECVDRSSPCPSPLADKTRMSSPIHAPRPDEAGDEEASTDKVVGNLLPSTIPNGEDPTSSHGGNPSPQEFDINGAPSLPSSRLALPPPDHEMAAGGPTAAPATSPSSSQPKPHSSIPDGRAVSANDSTGDFRKYSSIHWALGVVIFVLFATLTYTVYLPWSICYSFLKRILGGILAVLCRILAFLGLYSREE